MAADRTLAGRQMLVTGGNAGIGLATAQALHDRGADVVLACRNAAKAESALQTLKASPGGEVTVLPLDLASLQSVRDAAATFLRQHRPLHALILNAGVVPTRRILTVDGFEQQFAVNHLGHFLLAQLLLPALRAAAPARVVVVSSVMHRRGRVDPDSFRRTDGFYNPLQAYAQSKLLNVLFAREAARRWAADGIVVNAAHPGPIASEIYRDLPAPLRVPLLWFLRTPERGARTSVWLASDAAAGAHNGGYFANERPARASRRAKDDDLARRMWDESMRLAGL